MMALQTSADDRAQARWRVPRGDGQRIRMRRGSADSRTAARTVATARVSVRAQTGRPDRRVFIGEHAPHVLVIERIGKISPAGDVAPNASLDGLSLDVADEAVFYRRFCTALSDTPGCLVVVRQPLKRPGADAARSWIDTVIHALDDEAGAPDGLISANFFVACDARVVFNLAEWTSAAAHRKALKPADFTQHGSIGDSDAWRATREHVAITREHDVSRYPFIGRPDGREDGAC